MGQPGTAPGDCTPEICRFVVEQHLVGASMWCLLPLQDWFGLDPELRRKKASEERINVPAIPRYYWRYRMHLTIEDLLKASGFNRLILSLITESGRKSTL
jgi:4-alpha-glucanotransferase